MICNGKGPVKENQLRCCIIQDQFLKRLEVQVHVFIDSVLQRKGVREARYGKGRSWKDVIYLESGFSLIP